MSQLTVGKTYTTAGIAASSPNAKLKVDVISQRWEKICARPIKEITKEPFINDARKVSIPVGSGSSTSLKTFNRIPTATQPLEEGVTPKGQGYSVDGFSISVAEYGSWIAFTNQTDVTTSYGTITTEAMRELRRSAEESKAKIVRDTLVAQGSEFFANGKTNKGSLVAGDIATIVDLFSIRTSIIRNGGRLFGNTIKVVADFEVNTNLVLYDPVVSAYMNFGNTNEMLSSGEVSNLMGIQFLFQHFGNESDVTMIEHSTSGARITPIIVYAKDSFVIAQQKGGLGIQMIYKALGSSGTDDPLNQRGTFGWYIGNFGAKVKTPRHIVIYWVSIDIDTSKQVAPATQNVFNYGN